MKIMAPPGSTGSAEDGWVRGWSSILRYTGYRSSSSIINLNRNYGFPLRRLPPQGDPVIIKGEVNEWLRMFSEVSSPFRLRELSGAAKLAESGVLVGGGGRKEKEMVPGNKVVVSMLDWAVSERAKEASY